MDAMPFTAEQFFGVFAAYNQAVWPFQLALSGAAIAVAVLAWRRPEIAGPAVAGLLAFLWMWAGVAYHLMRFTKVNPAAWAFGTLFVLQAVLFAVAGFRHRITIGASGDPSWTLGAIGIGYALGLYPILGTALGHAYPGTPTFGVPCPTTIYSFSILLWTRGRFPLHLLVIPSLWALAAAPAALGWGVLEDVGMPLSAVVAVLLLIRRNRRLRSTGADGSPSSLATAS
jgi:hypothetical protein